MADPKHLDHLKQGETHWNQWREEHPDIWPDLHRADLEGATLDEAKLIGADLSQARLLETRFQGADLTNCRIYGISAWNLQLDENTIQQDLVISSWGEPTITVDNIEVAQFIYLLLHNEKIRNVIDTISKKVVLILGRFTPERKAVLDAIREALRSQYDYVPVVFDFEKSESQDIIQTVSTLAHLARFIIADLSEAKTAPAELERIVPALPSVPVQPLLVKSDKVYAGVEQILVFPSVLPIYHYKNSEELLVSLKDHVLKPANDRADQLQKKLALIRQQLATGTS